MRRWLRVLCLTIALGGAVLPTLSGMATSGDACANACDDNCAPGCPQCTCVHRPGIAIKPPSQILTPAAATSPVAARGVAYRSLLDAERLYRPPRA
jgi:hypothetical protein